MEICLVLYGCPISGHAFFFFISPFCQDNETNKSRFREQNWSNQMVSQVKIVTMEIS